MKKLIRSISFLVFLLLAFSLGAQDNQRFGSWIDAQHFTIRRGDELFLVDARNGREKPYEEPPGARALLPEGVRATSRNSVSSADGSVLVLQQNNDLFLASEKEGAFRQLTANPEAEQNPTLSPDSRYVAYTRGGNLFALDLTTGLERQLTYDGSDVVYNGYASWVYYEEILGRRSRYQAFYWSPDSKRIAFLRFDDTPVPTFPIFHHEAEDNTHGYLEVTRYPKAGDPLPHVQLGIAEVAGGELLWVDTDEALDYTAWIDWTPDAEQLFFQQMNRDQDTLRLYAADPATGAAALLYEEAQPTWVTFFEDIHFLPEGRGFLLRSNRDGWYNLYHYAMDGTLVRQLTDFDWRVTEIAAVDAANDRILFEGSGGDGTQVHLFSVGLDGENLRQLTQGEGYHAITVAPGGGYFYDRHSSYNLPWRGAVYDIPSGGLVREVEPREDSANAAAGIRVEHFSVPTGDGYDLPAYWVLPPGFDENKRYPVIFSIYGGPDAGTVYKRYRDYSSDDLLREGVIYFAVDHRASGKFGKKGLDFMHRNLGKWEMHDYIEAVKWLRERPFVDSTRMGIQGGSYGGYMTALALTYAADYFTHGVSRAPVTDWRLYDNVYTERYMDAPADNPAGYEFGSVMTHADRLQGKLLLIHGTIDDNVHMQNTIQLVSKLQDLGKDFDMMVYPGGRHGWGGAKRVHSGKLAERFWREVFIAEGKEAKP